MPMSKTSKTILLSLLLGVSFAGFAQVYRTDDFRERYTLKQVVVLSRHNIRSPLSGRRSTLQRITPHEWYQWSSAPSELSLRGGALETMMGQYFRKWLVSEGLMRENEIPTEGAMRFYANSLQRTIATAQYFSSGMLPVANVRIEHHCELGRMGSVFAPRLSGCRLLPDFLHCPKHPQVLLLNADAFQRDSILLVKHNQGIIGIGHLRSQLNLRIA